MEERRVVAFNLDILPRYFCSHVCIYTDTNQCCFHNKMFFRSKYLNSGTRLYLFEECNLVNSGLIIHKTIFISNFHKSEDLEENKPER